MNADYELLAHRIRAAYPSFSISDMTIVDWTSRLLEADDLDHASRMARKLSNLPSPPDPYDWRNARRDTREVEYVRALPSGPVEPAEMDDETRERWEALKATLRERPIFKEYPKAFDDLPDEVFTKRPPIAPRIRAGCVGVLEGEGFRDQAGHLRCAVCSDDLCPSCPPTPIKERNCKGFRAEVLAQSNHSGTEKGS